MSNVKSLYLGTSFGGGAVEDPLMLQNRSSSAETAHAITEASVNGHRLYSYGKNCAN